MRKRGCRAGVQRCQKGSTGLERRFPIQADTAASPSVSHLNSSFVIDVALFDQNTVEPPPSSPPIEVLDTDKCPRVWLPEEIPAEVLDAHVLHHYSGEKGISPVVRSWCIQKFCELNPGVPCFVLI
jgi:hypothetical protein